MKMKMDLYKREQEILNSITVEGVISDVLIIGKYEGRNYVYDTRKNTINFNGLVIQLREKNKIYNRIMEILNEVDLIVSI